MAQPGIGQTESRAKKVFKVIFYWFVILLVFGAIGAGIYGWKNREKLRKLMKATSSESQYKTDETINVDGFTGYCIVRSPEVASSLKQDGIKLKIVDDKADYVARLKALRDGKADIAVFTVDSLLKSCYELGLSLEDCPATIAMVIDESMGADAVVAYKSAVRNIQDLNKPGAGFVATPNSPSEFLARVVVNNFSLLRLPQKWLIEADGAKEVYAKLKSASKTDPKAYVLWEPYLSMALADPEVHVLLGSDKLKGYIVDVLVVRREFMLQKPELVSAFVQAYLRAAYTYNQEGMLNLVMEDSKLTGEKLNRDQAEKLIKGIQWKNTLENYAHFRLLGREKAKGLEDMEDIISKIGSTLVATGAVKKDFVNTKSLGIVFCNKVLLDLQAGDFHPGRKLNIIKDDSGMASMGEVRGEAELPLLTEEEWSKLLSVGQMKVEPIEFGRGSAELGIQSRRDLDQLSANLKSLPKYYLKVIGHTRSDGDLSLASDRANIAVEYLALRTGVSRNRLRAFSDNKLGEGGDTASVSFQLCQKPY